MISLHADSHLLVHRQLLSILLDWHFSIDKHIILVITWHHFILKLLYLLQSLLLIHSLRVWKISIISILLWLHNRIHELVLGTIELHTFLLLIEELSDIWIRLLVSLISWIQEHLLLGLILLLKWYLVHHKAFILLLYTQLILLLERLLVYHMETRGLLTIIGISLLLNLTHILKLRLILIHENHVLWLGEIDWLLCISYH